MKCFNVEILRAGRVVHDKFMDAATPQEAIAAMIREGWRGLIPSAYYSVRAGGCVMSVAGDEFGDGISADLATTKHDALRPEDGLWRQARRGDPVFAKGGLVGHLVGSDDGPSLEKCRQKFDNTQNWPVLNESKILAACYFCHNHNCIYTDTSHRHDRKLIPFSGVDTSKMLVDLQVADVSSIRVDIKVGRKFYRLWTTLSSGRVSVHPLTEEDWILLETL